MQRPKSASVQLPLWIRNKERKLTSAFVLQFNGLAWLFLGVPTSSSLLYREVRVAVDHKICPYLKVVTAVPGFITH